MADAQEIAELEQLRLQYPAIQQAIEEFELSLEKTAFAASVSPAPSVKNKLFFELENEFAPAIKSVSSEIKSSSPIIQIDNSVNESNYTNDNSVEELPKQAVVRSMSFLKAVSVAAVFLLIASAALNVYFYSKYNEANKQVTALLSDKNTLIASNKSMQVKYSDIYSNLLVVSDTNVQKVSLKPIAGKEGSLATVYWNTLTKDVYVVADGLPKAPKGKQYQLWALVDGKPVDAGMIEDCNGVCKVKNTIKAQTFAITLEKFGGSPSPDLTQLYVIGNVTS
jgi:Anti-sigma-K factor rskA